jgi:putative SOS response-associated peptidase YedK
VRTIAEPPNSREAVLMRWGLIPFWAKDMAIGNQLINARSETVAEKPSFRNAFNKRRCLIPADGFFEWQKLSTGKKQPWLIEQRDQQPFAMAGLWECWTPKTHAHEDPQASADSDAETTTRAQPVISCTILTTEANDDMKPLHDRMPVILPIEAWAAWLSPQASKEQVHSLLQPRPSGQLVRTCVSTVVNRPFPDNADCIVPVPPPEPLGPGTGAEAIPDAPPKRRPARKRMSDT